MYLQCVANSCWAESYIIHILNPILVVDLCHQLKTPKETIFSFPSFPPHRS